LTLLLLARQIITLLTIVFNVQMAHNHIKEEFIVHAQHRNLLYLTLALLHFIHAKFKGLPFLHLLMAVEWIYGLTLFSLFGIRDLLMPDLFSLHQIPFQLYLIILIF
jgi:hypothetical protein